VERAEGGQTIEAGLDLGHHVDQVHRQQRCSDDATGDGAAERDHRQPLGAAGDGTGEQPGQTGQDEHPAQVVRRCHELRREPETEHGTERENG
jgi:hypothetical protein